MADVHSNLPSSPSKRRRLQTDGTSSPKRPRTLPPTPPITPLRKNANADESPLPPHLSRLQSIHTELQHALSHALATCAVSPSSDTGIIRNVLNHLSLNTYAGLSTQFTLEDLRRLCWIWEWDGKSRPLEDDDEDNPFIVKPSVPPNWTRGGMGIIVSSATHLLKTDGKRVPAYGIGIEVGTDIGKDMGGMAAVARWTSAAETRREEFQTKLNAWLKMHPESVPKIPIADLPVINLPGKTSSLTRTFASVSPKASPSASTLAFPKVPSSPSRSPSKSPTKSARNDLAALSLVNSPSRSSSPTKSLAPFPATPSRSERLAKLLTPHTTRTFTTSDAVDALPPQLSTSPSHDHSSSSETPTTARREALYERIRKRSLSASPTKNRRIDLDGTDIPVTRDQMLKLEQDEMRKKCLLGRLGGVAESVWMLFSTPNAGSSNLPTSRKRRTLPRSDVASAVVKSSPVPISSAEANESLDMLTKLCPFFLKPFVIASEDWLEMPPSTPSSATLDANSVKDSDHELLTRSPKRVKNEARGLREVREIIRRELELHD
ncbi:hypothetical protein D9758_001195 [Tetrapyrgos nigripes]|uniref:DNA replication factor Cdt1 C-terminal domain-containing protein n=1 Tax=Tetrapyrgos nigripes TaxID=182062 RepID=A0A8H5GR83_9AGAR|nr:hypothetical protein D9758_001195 [Tetrapyrgos nigripes]